MTDIIEILVKSDKSITELDDDFLFSQNVLSVSQYAYNGELYFNLLFDQKDRSCIKKIISKLFGSSQYFQINKVKNKNWVLESQKTLEPLSFNGLYIHNDGHMLGHSFLFFDREGIHVRRFISTPSRQIDNEESKLYL